jgi:hypothetical protein
LCELEPKFVRVLVTKSFKRFQRKEQIGDRVLLEAVERAERGLVDSDIGGGLIKQRVARAGQGRSGGYRTIVAFRASGRAIFLFGFAKSTQANIDSATLAHWQAISTDLMVASDDAIDQAIMRHELNEVLP